MLLSQVSCGGSVKHVPRRHYSTHLLNPVAETGDVITHDCGMRLRHVNLENVSIIRSPEIYRHREGLPPPPGDFAL